MDAIPDNLLYIALHPASTNEFIPKQLPEFLDELLLLAEESVARGKARQYSGQAGAGTADDSNSDDFSDLRFTPATAEKIKSAIAQLKLALSCSRKCMEIDGSCIRGCPCAKASATRLTGCTLWCHPKNFHTAKHTCIPRGAAAFFPTKTQLEAATKKESSLKLLRENLDKPYKVR
ncbi:hypothetical protein H2199_001490 [Coniosporium tulheliwenetii]|uniref:Uncharacterized protein n=1 Tax=Coniosporium tulheliwenetii TaxID=3383036 RepID=A0ACC2ZM19_9PEZI|nr:hypothetical protein H2199_001490 [Cladosporium sp. JES 115]